MKSIPLKPRASISHQPSSTSKPRPPVNPGLTRFVNAERLQWKIEFRALDCVNRFRYVRTIDIAIDCFAERPYLAARQAARRAMTRLRKAGYLKKFRTKRHHTIYALTEAGAKRLFDISDGRIDAKSTIRGAANLTNPEHLLWSNFTVLACEARGIRAVTEHQLIANLTGGIKKEGQKLPGLLRVVSRLKVVGNDTPTEIVHLRPDALAFEPEGLTWFEIDASRRSESRRARLLALIRALGTNVPAMHADALIAGGRSILTKIVVLALEPHLESRLRAMLDSIVSETRTLVLTEDTKTYRLVSLGNGAYELWKAKYNNEGTRQVDVSVGHVILQLAPTWLPNYQGSSPAKSQPLSWFSDNYLPYRKPASLAPWAAPTTPPDFYG